MKRSEFISKITLSAFSFLSLPLINSCGQKNNDHRLQTSFAEILNTQTKDKLWLFYNSVMSNWGMEDYSNFTKADFDKFIDNRIRFNKKYIYAYNLMEEHIHADTVGNFTLTQKQLLNQDESETIMLIIKEFQTQVVISGGFKKFHLKNYYGFVGGAYTNLNALPYRT